MALAMVHVSNCRMASKVARDSGCVVAADAASYLLGEIPIQVVGQLKSGVLEGEDISQEQS
jgi:hypothetical protein